MLNLFQFMDPFGFFQGFIILGIVITIIIIIVVILIIYFVVRAFSGGSNRKKPIYPDQPYVNVYRASPQPYSNTIQPPPQVKYCEYCGQKIEANANFCPFCDAQIK
jgi:hypothetical protein